MSDRELLEAVETILFTTPKPLPPRKIVELSGDRFSSKEIRDAIKNLNRQFEKTGRVFRIEAVGDGFQMRTLTEFGRWVQKLETVKTIKLSMATMETLSIIACYPSGNRVYPRSRFIPYGPTSDAAKTDSNRRP